MSPTSSLLVLFSTMFSGHFLEAAVTKCPFALYKAGICLLQLDHATHVNAKPNSERGMQTGLINFNFFHPLEINAVQAYV